KFQLSTKPTPLDRHHLANCLLTPMVLPDSTSKETSLRESKLEGCCQGPQDLSFLKKNEFHAASL
ncbi:unnamed protein product, partial [Bubo scandiacus]